MPPAMFIPPAGNSQPEPPPQPKQDGEDNAAVNMIRDKVNQAYAEEPNVKQELQEAEEAPKRSAHQQYMHDLSTSGKDFATIQTEWHNYYQSLPAHEKHQVWEEFYSSQAQPVQTAQAVQPPPKQLAEHKHEVVRRTKRARKQADSRSPQEIRAAIKDKVSAGGKLEAKHHIQSLLFGLAMGCVVLVIFLFSFFNEVIVAPFIQPSRAQAATPLIISSDSVAPTTQPEVIIPKINVEIPVDYSQTTTDESQIENALNSGVVHYPTTVMPGQTGNAAFFGHSSNNIFNPGKYKFAFVLLHTLVPGDTFYLTNNGKVYVYKIFSKTVVPPSDVSVLNPVSGHNATATLITCDPPGTSLNRLVIVGDQISPDPTGNTQGTPTSAGVSGTSTALPGNGPTLWARFVSTIIGKAAILVVLAVVFWLTIRWVNQPKRMAPKAASP